MDKTELIFENMWYASAKKAKSRSKRIVYDDKHGVLTINRTNNTFSYLGDKVRIENAVVKAVASRKQSFHYWGYAVYALPLIIFYVAKQDVLYGMLGILAGVLVGSFIWYSMKWIVIEYQMPNKDKLEWAWFYDGSYNGWGGIEGTSKKLKEIKYFLGIN